MRLTEQERLILSGAEGEARRIALQNMVDYAEALGADSLLDVDCASIGFPARYPVSLNAGQEFDTFEDMLSYAALATTEKVEFRDMKAKRVVTNNGSVSREWLDYLGVTDKRLYDCVDEMERFYREHGVNNTCTCAPYLLGNVPTKGAHVVTGESSQVIFENSVLGAKTNCEGDIAISCAAIVGKIPNCGLHLDENRKGTHLIKVDKLPTDYFEWDLMGYWIGKHVKLGVPVLDMDIENITFDQYKGLGAAMTTSGQIDLYHVIGHTPEAATYEMAFGGHEPKEILHYGAAEEAEIRRRLDWAPAENAVDMVLLGCPHYSAFQVAEAARLLKGRSCKSRLVIMTAPATMEQARINGDAQVIQAAGGLLTSSCPPMVALWPENIKTLATDSAKMAHYVPSTQPFAIHAGTMSRCIEAAVTGTW